MRTIEIAGEVFPIRYGRKEAQYMERNSNPRRSAGSVCFSFAVDDQNLVILAGIRGGDPQTKITATKLEQLLEQHEAADNDVYAIWEECLRAVLESRILPKYGQGAEVIAAIESMLEERGKAQTGKTVKAE